MAAMQTGNTAAQTQAAQANNAIAVNAAIRQAILNNSVEVKQQIFSETIANPGATQNQIQIPFRNVGLVKGFIVKVSATFAEAAAAGTALTDWGAANLLSNVTLYDLDNYQRINTTGWHLNAIGTAKEGFPHGAALANAAYTPGTAETATLGAKGIAYPVNYNDNFGAIQATPPTNAATGSVDMYYWVPLAYSAQDLRGAIFAGVVNATAYLQLTLNPTPFVAAGSDMTNAVFTGADATRSTSISSATVQVYQVYLDQLPRYQSGPQAGAPILPPIDIATQYRLNNTSLFGVSSGQDFPVPFSNFQQFLSLTTIYDQAGALANGTDINYFALAAANTYLPFKLDPITQAWISRHKIMTDFPPGSYMFDFRGQPISTNQTGNMQLLVNAITAAAGSQVLAGFESFALVNTVLGAASLPAS